MNPLNVPPSTPLILLGLIVVIVLVLLARRPAIVMAMAGSTVDASTRTAVTFRIGT